MENKEIIILKYFITYIEIFFKFLYFYSDTAHRFFLKILSLNKKFSKNNDKYCFNVFKKKISSIFSDGDTIIIHSSNDFFKKYNIKPEMLIDYLLEVVGESGNLIIPSIPLLRPMIPYKNLIFMDTYPVESFYDPHRTRPWTGILSFAAMSYPGFIRSINPLNTMSVIGRNKNDIVRNDLFCSKSMACDKNSVLGISLEYNSKILFLDVEPIHSMTMIHCNEDLDVSSWPIKNWYWERKFNIKINNNIESFILRERRPFWTIFFSQKRLSIDLNKYGVLKNENLHNFSYCRSKDLMSFLEDRKSTGYPYFVPFWMRK